MTLQDYAHAPSGFRRVRFFARRKDTPSLTVYSYVEPSDLTVSRIEGLIAAFRKGYRLDNSWTIKVTPSECFKF